MLVQMHSLFAGHGKSSVANFPLMCICSNVLCRYWEVVVGWSSQ